MAPKGTQVVTRSIYSTKLPGSSAPTTERPAYPGRLPVSAAARPGGAVQRRLKTTRARQRCTDAQRPRLLSKRPGATE
jgi:hypothetical protein